MSGDNVVNKGKMTIDRSAIGQGATVTFSADHKDPPSVTQWDIGVITIIPVETQSVRHALDLAPDRDDFHTGERFGRVVAVQADGPGQGDTAAAAQRLVDRYSPRMLALVGIAGGISPVVGIGDVVVATQVVYYDLRRETPDGANRRGRAWQVHDSIIRSINQFFIKHGSPAEFPRFKVHAGVIGSGDAVITDENSPIREYLTTFNEKTLAVDMESDGLAQFCHKDPGVPWVVVRGISDDASVRKGYAHHATAADNAAFAFSQLLPYLTR